MSEVNVQKSAGCNEIKINVKPVPVNPVVLENSYRGIDYNVLKHKPQIEGNELIGNKTAKELLGFDKTDMDATVSVAKGAEEVAHAANEKAQNAVDIANAAKETAEGIDAKATEALTNSNTAVNTANSAKQTAQGVDGKATQALENSATALETANQAKATADSFQGTITTLRNDVDDLGDQVAIIEGKIPAEATTANPLADKKFVTTITNELATDITALDGRVNTLETDNAQNKIDIAKNAGDIAALDADIQKINLIKWVQALPATGETKYLYAVPQDEKTLDGENIVLLFVWNDTDGWAAVGVQTTAVDLSEYAKQLDLAAETSARKEADQVLETATAAKYGPDNLTAGAGVEIKEYTVPTLIDAHTLAVFKFEDTAVPAENSVAEGAVFANRGGAADGTTAAGAKFGARAFRCDNSNVSGWLRNSDSIPNADYTVDFWVKWGDSGRAGVCTGVNSDAPTGRGVIFYKNKLALPQAAGTGYINKDSVFDTAYDGAVWHHVAYEQKGHAYRVYIDGVQVAQGEYTSFGSQSELYIWGWGGVLIDEVRVSDIARYDGDFTPNTQPYAYAEHKQYEITAKASGAGLPLLSVHWSDHLLNRMDMLRADTFSWQDGTVYTAAYNELLTEYNNAASADETDGSISFKRTPKGYKICAADQHDNVSALYDSTGVAWYYILDVPNKRFKLPRTKFGFTGLRTRAGNYVAPGLPNITAKMMGTTYGGLADAYVNASGACRTEGSGGASAKGGEEFFLWKHDFDASRSSSVYGSSQTVQPPATEMYLYFFVGNFTQSAVEQTAGLNAELFNGKADRDLANVPANIDYVVESYKHGNNWYRKYKSGWLEQGGIYKGTFNTTSVHNLLVPFADTTYSILGEALDVSDYTVSWCARKTSFTTTSFTGEGFRGVTGNYTYNTLRWEAKGQGAN